MDFRVSDYSPAVRQILALGESGLRVMPLAPAGTSSEEARQAILALDASAAFSGARSPQGALSGLYLYFSCLDEGHTVAQSLETTDGSFWHGIMHRQEPDPDNAGYWFRRVGKHPVFPALAIGSRELGYRSGDTWDPHAFIDYCETARRRPGSKEETLARRVQLLEWQLLFQHCARPEANLS